MKKGGFIGKFSTKKTNVQFLQRIHFKNYLQHIFLLSPVLIKALPFSAWAFPVDVFPPWSESGRLDKLYKPWLGKMGAASKYGSSTRTLYAGCVSNIRGWKGWRWRRSERGKKAAALSAETSVYIIHRVPPLNFPFPLWWVCLKEKIEANGRVFHFWEEWKHGGKVLGSLSLPDARAKFWRNHKI